MELKLPNLGEGADSGTVVNLFVKEGDQITKDQPILELENEKAVATIPATAAGTVTKIHVRTGEKITVGQNLLSLTTTETAAPAEKDASVTPPSKPKESPEPNKTEEAKAETPKEQKSGSPPAASPSIRKLASDLGLDLSRVQGSERGGRIVLADLRAYVQKLQSSPAGPQPATAAPAGATSSVAKAEPIDFAKWGAVTRKPLSPLRQVIARRMSESWAAIPRVTQFDEADVTVITNLRKQYAPAYEQKAARLTLTSFLLKSVVDTLKKHPLLNASLDQSEMVIKNYFHIGIAVDTEAGLIVPIIRDVDKKSVLELSKELEALAKKARDRKISAEELKGGTFTISNQGGIGSGHFTPIVNKPEVAILGLGRGAAKPVVRENKIEVRVMLPITLAYDHRLIDGAAAAHFTVDLVHAVENFKEDDVRV